jgi:hypothetical protein
VELGGAKYVGLDGAKYVGLDGAKYVGLDGARWVYMELGGARWNLVKHKGPNHLDLVAAIASCGNMTFQSFFSQNVFDLVTDVGRDSLHSTKKITENFVIDGVQL